MKPLRIALFYDKITKYGGAERVIQALHAIWPQSPVYTSIFKPQNTLWAKDMEIKSSFLNYLPFVNYLSWIYSFLSPKSIERFKFDSYDAVIAVTSSYGIRLRTGSTPFFLYHLTPTRYLWSGYFDYLAEPGFGLGNSLVRIIYKAVAPILRWQELYRVQRSMIDISISEEVKKRVEKYYRRSSSIIYPPVDTHTFDLSKSQIKDEFFLIVSRLVPYKKIDYAIEAFNDMKLPLVVVGQGIDLNRLKKKAGVTIQFVTTCLTDKELAWYYQKCSALIFPGAEDFGITPVEAQACGKPVIGLYKGGLKEIIQEGITGEFYKTPDKSALIQKVKEFYTKKYSSSLCRKNALRFSQKKFKEKFKDIVENNLKKL